MNTYKVVGDNWEIEVEVDETIFGDPFMEAATKATEKVFDINYNHPTSDSSPPAVGANLRVFSTNNWGEIKYKLVSSESVFLNASLWNAARLIKESKAQI